MPYSQIKPVIDLGVRGLCQRAYYNHPRGCPNYGKKNGCPPDCRTICQIISRESPVYAIWNKFDFAGHCLEMRRQHPAWSKRQVECCLYWQPKARKQLSSEITKFLAEHHNFIIVANPEGAGVNLTKSMQAIGIELEWPPETVAYQISLAGQRGLFER